MDRKNSQFIVLPEQGYTKVMRSKIGIFSGTFDPVHPGHIAFAQEALRACELDEVVFIPEQKPRGKSQVTAISHRIALINHATADISGIRAMQLESVQFNVQQTLPELQKIFKNCSLTLLLGSDVIRTLHRWEGIERLLANVSLAIGMRSNDKSEEIAAILDQLTRGYAVAIDYKLISTSEAHMASSAIRNGTAAMPSLHPEALAYIQRYGLYTQ